MKSLRFEDIDDFFVDGSLTDGYIDVQTQDSKKIYAFTPRKPLNIVLANTFDISGGAARAAYRLHQGLNRIGLNSRMVVQDKRSDDPRVLGPANPLEKIDSFFRGHLDQIPLLFYPRRSETPFSPSVVPFSPALGKIHGLEPDLVHLHWVQKSMLTVEDIRRIRAPIVWTMHDMWPFTGGEHYDEDQHHFSGHCGSSVVLGSQKDRDLSRQIWKKKQHQWAKVDLTLVSPSRWLAQMARESSLFAHRRIEVIPNGIDTEIFYPLDKALARKLLKIQTKDPILLFPAMDPTSDPRKGFDLLLEALGRLKARGEKIHLLVMGASGMKNARELGFPVTFLGRLQDDVTLNLAYNAADAVAVPSRQENFANTLLEALACGLPCTAFDLGGNPDFIQHKENGYLARPLDCDDLAQGISWALNKKHREKAGELSRQKTLAEYGLEAIARRYETLYREVLTGKTR